MYECTELDCCKEKVGIGQCTTWWNAGNQCGSVDKALEFRKSSVTKPRCPTTSCSEADCCVAAPTCDGFTGCLSGTVLTHVTTTCKSSACVAKECCVARGVCAAAECPVGETLVTGHA